MLEAWRDASAEAAAALQSWRGAPGDTVAYVAYRAAQDREDAAQDALVSHPDDPDERLVAAVRRVRLGGLDHAARPGVLGPGAGERIGASLVAGEVGRDRVQTLGA